MQFYRVLKNSLTNSPADEVEQFRTLDDLLTTSLERNVEG